MAEPGLERVPPQSREAERCVLGSMLRDNMVINDVLQIVNEESFYFDAHQKIFRAVRTIHDSGKPVDLVILAEHLNSQKQLEDVGRGAYLAELWDAAPTAANAEHYAHIVREKGITRSLIHASTEILRDSYDQSQPADELLAKAERQVLEIAELGVVGQTVTLVEALDETYARIDARNQHKHTSVSGVPTGFVDLDEMTAGLQQNELIILAARPSVGKTAFSLNVVRHIVVEEHLPVFFVSLEQSRIELTERLLCCQAKVDSHKLRKGHLSSDDMNKLIEAGDVLRQAKLFIDDSPAQGMIRIAANARRLRHRHDIRMVVIDYLQLIDPENRRDPRQEQVAQISRRLKFLARELKVPVMALAQVNRASEDRQDHRPRLADLRESGCLTGDTLVTLAESGERVPMKSLAGKSGFQVWALDETTMKLSIATVARAFATGRKPVFRLETGLGRVIKATANHQFRGFDCWKRLDEFQVGDYVALPRRIVGSVADTMPHAELALLGHLIGDGCTLPRHAIQYTTREADLAQTVVDLAREAFGPRVQPRIRPERTWNQVYLASSERLTHGKRNAVAEWLDRLGVFGLRSHEKRAPELLFQQSSAGIAIFLRHLWATDGCIRAPRGLTRHPAIYYASSSERLARDVQSLLLRLGINAVLRSRSQSDKGRTQFHVLIMGSDDIMSFANQIGAVGAYKLNSLLECVDWLSGRSKNTNRDIIPHQVWRELAAPAMKRNGITLRKMHAALGNACCGTTIYKQNVSRDRLRRLNRAVGGDDRLAALAESDVYWDRIRAIEPVGIEEVFDLTVPGPANFVANDVIAHNSIEQDADTVMMLHRPGRFDGAQEDNVIEVLVAKQRNGPTGDITLAFLKQFMRFENYAVGDSFGV